MIPPFDHNYVLPPYVGTSPAKRAAQSPYPTDIVEFCQKFAFSPARIAILKDFVAFRLEFYNQGLNGLIQWIDGSFVEDKMRSLGQEPNDIDVVTIVPGMSDEQVEKLKKEFPEFVYPSKAKSKFNVDHYLLSVSDPITAIRNTQYWIQLFSHNRRGVWKGMLEIPLNKDNTDDLTAMSYLNSL